MKTSRSALWQRGSWHRRLGITLIALVVPVYLASCVPASGGSLDTSFSGDGVATYIDGTGEVRASVQQTNGMTVVAGSGYYEEESPSKQAVYVARYDTAGNVDAAFGTRGFAKVNLVNGPEVVRAITVDTSGRVIVTGLISAQDYPDDSDIFVFRLTPSGQPDSNFGGGDGIVMIDRSTHDRVGSVVVSGSRVLVGGTFDADGNWGNQWTVVALNAAGNVDTTFNGDGIATVPTSRVGDFDGVRSIALQTDGKILLGGSHGNEFASARLSTDGNVDTTWDGDGVARTLVSNGGAGYTVLAQADGKVVLAGFARPGGTRSDEDMAAVRWTKTGALDPTFDGDGKVLLDFGQQANDRAYSAALTADSKVVLGGFANTSTGMDLAVARLNTNGSPDASFSDDGRNTTNWGKTANEQFESVTVGPNGRVIGAGWYHDRWLLAAYTGGTAAKSLFGM